MLELYRRRAYRRRVEVRRPLRRAFEYGRENEAVLRSTRAFSDAYTEFAITGTRFRPRLGESGCDAWTLARIAGHISIAICSRYVHPYEDVVLTAASRLSGHNFGHKQMG